jgi:hypothetical protein
MPASCDWRNDTRQTVHSVMNVRVTSSKFITLYREVGSVKWRVDAVKPGICDLGEGNAVIQMSRTSPASAAT